MPQREQLLADGADGGWPSTYAAPCLAARGRTKRRESIAVRVPPVAVVEANRRLAVILAADIVGYSRLMALDEDGTVQTLATYQEVIAALVAEHAGPDLQSRRRRDHGRVRQRGAGGALRGGDPAHGRAPQRRPRRGSAGGVPDRPQSGRRGGARRRSARRRRQCRGAAAGVGRARADLHLGGGARADRRQGRVRLRARAASTASSTSRGRFTSTRSTGRCRRRCRWRNCARAPCRSRIGRRSPSCRSPT